MGTTMRRESPAFTLEDGRPTYDDTSRCGIDRRLMHTLRFGELRARTECRAELEVEAR